MGVATTHEDYNEMSPLWERCRDAADGQDAIHAAGEKYLPRLSEQSDKEYTSYLQRTPFFNATWRTIAGLRGMIFRKPPTVEVPGSMESMLQDIGMNGTSLLALAQEVVEEVLTVGRCGLFVDYPMIASPTALTEADAKRLNLRPMARVYDTECILNWRTTQYRNREVLSMVRLLEEVEVVVSEFDTKCKEQYRVLDLVPDANLGMVYRVRVFQLDEKGNDVLVEGPYFPIIRGKNPDFIPFYFVGIDDTEADPDTPPLIDLVDVNISHFRTSADYEHGCHFTGLPTPVISGYTPTNADEKFGIGSTTAWVFPRPEAKAFFLEFAGSGLSSLERNLDRKEKQMAVLGARMLDGDLQIGQDSGAATAINLGGEQSLLASISQSISEAVANALRGMATFAGEDPASVKFLLNKDFFPMAMSPLALTALVAGWQNGAYSYDTLFAALKRGEIVDPDATIAEELAAMDTHKPVIPAGTKVNQDAAPRHEVTMPTQRQMQTP